MNSEQRYFLDHYGECLLKNKCLCLRQGWLGTLCNHWLPAGVTNLEQLEQWQRKKAQKNDINE